MFNLRLTSKPFALLAFTALLLSAFGCNMGSVTAPDSGSVKIVPNPDFIRILSTPKGKTYPFRTQSNDGMVSAELGGTVTNGWVTLYFPPYALDEDTKIIIDMPEPNKFIFELEPHGIQFNEPVTITLELSGTDAEGMADYACVIWFNDEKGWWEEIVSVGTDDSNHSKALLKHFSRYASTVGG